MDLRNQGDEALEQYCKENPDSVARIQEEEPVQLIPPPHDSDPSTADAEAPVAPVADSSPCHQVPAIEEHNHGQEASHEAEMSSKQHPSQQQRASPAAPSSEIILLQQAMRIYKASGEFAMAERCQKDIARLEANRVRFQADYEKQSLHRQACGEDSYDEMRASLVTRQQEERRFANQMQKAANYYELSKIVTPGGASFNSLNAGEQANVMAVWRKEQEIELQVQQHQAAAKQIAGPLVSSGLSRQPLHIAMRLDMKFAEFPEAAVFLQAVAKKMALSLGQIKLDRLDAVVAHEDPQNPVVQATVEAMIPLARHGKVLRDARARLRGNSVAGAKVLLVDAYSVNPAKRGGGSPAPYPYESRSMSPEPLSPQGKEATKRAVQDMVATQRDKIRQEFRDRQSGTQAKAVSKSRASSLLLEAREHLQEAQVEVAAAMTQHWAEEQRWQEEQESHVHI